MFCLMLLHRFREDLQLAKDAGCTAFRFSFEWARIEPTRGKFDEEAIARCVTFAVHLPCHCNHSTLSQARFIGENDTLDAPGRKVV